MKILFVCIGNICRSPIADAIMNNLIKANNLHGRIEIDSAGTQSFHAGEQADYRAIRTSSKFGIDLDYHRARQITKKDFDYYDRIYTMATDVHNNVVRMAVSDEHRKKVILFMDIISPGKNLSVPDPWYGDEAGFTPVFQLINQGCRSIMDEISEQGY